MLVTGAVYAWGLNKEGQLGVGNDVGRDMPTLLEAHVLAGVHVVKAYPRQLISTLNFTLDITIDSGLNPLTPCLPVTTYQGTIS